MERGEFEVEGHMQIGPHETFFIFVDGEYLARLLLQHFGLPEERGYSELGRVRLAVERLEEPQT